MNTLLALAVPIAALAVILGALNWHRLRAWVWRRDETDEYGA